jgi:hypothetical protein
MAPAGRERRSLLTASGRLVVRTAASARQDELAAILGRYRPPTAYEGRGRPARHVNGGPGHDQHGQRRDGVPERSDQLPATTDIRSKVTGFPADEEGIGRLAREKQRARNACMAVPTPRRAGSDRRVGGRTQG